MEKGKYIYFYYKNWIKRRRETRKIKVKSINRRYGRQRRFTTKSAREATRSFNKQTYLDSNRRDTTRQTKILEQQKNF